MSNEEQMRAEFEAWCEESGIYLLSMSESLSGYIADSTEVRWEAWQAATASKQREIAALSQQVAKGRQLLREQMQLTNERTEECLRLQQQVLELSAQVEVMRVAGGLVCKKLEHPTDSVTALDMWKLRDALSINQSAALLAHDNEVLSAYERRTSEYTHQCVKCCIRYALDDGDEDCPYCGCTDSEAKAIIEEAERRNRK